MAYGDDDVHGVGGWLALLIFGMLIGGPLRSLAGTMSDLNGAERANPALIGLALWGTIKAFTWVVTLTSIVASAHAGWRLGWRLRPSSVKIAIWTLWLAGPMMTLIAVSGVSLLSGTGFSEIWTAGMATPFAYAAIWTAYLLKSDRVRNTYVEDDETAALAATFE